MLALSLTPGEFICVGETIIRVVRWSRSTARVAIDAASDDRILRFDAQGKLKTGLASVVSHSGTSALILKMSCGHAVADSDALIIEGQPRCPICHDLAARISGRIHATFQRGD
jgi:sRNA-binding carbon storage regulator CsrA